MAHVLVVGSLSPDVLSPRLRDMTPAVLVAPDVLPSETIRISPIRPVYVMPRNRYPRNTRR